MKRGDLIIVSLPGDFGKPRPAVVVQSDELIGLETVIVCPLTTDVDARLAIRPIFVPSNVNGLNQTSQAMVEKIMTFRLKRTAEPIGRLDADDLVRLDRILAFVPGLDTGR